MGSHTITYTGVALAIALVSLLAGFLWGRSDVKSKIESALEKASVALDAREFAMRQQLDEAVAEVARLRPLADELGAVQERLRREQAKYERMKAEFNASVNAPATELPSNEPQPEPHPTESADEAIQKLLQSLEAFNAPEDGVSTVPGDAVPDSVVPGPVPPRAQRIEPVVAPPLQAPRAVPIAQIPQLHTSPEPLKPTQLPPAAPRQQPSIRQQPKPVPVQPQAVKPSQAQNPAPPQTRKPAPAVPAKSNPAPPAKSGQPLDEWQEFARQLEALTGKKK